MNNSAFHVGDELIVDKTRANILGSINASQWANTGKYWARGTNSKSRTTAARGTHKVFKSRAKEIRRLELAAAKASAKQQLNVLGSQLNKMGLGSASAAASATGALPINEEFIHTIMTTANPNNIVYGKKFSRLVLNSDIPLLREYVQIRMEEGKSLAQIASELTALRNSGELKGALAVLKKTKSNLIALNAMLAGLEMDGGKKRRHTKRHKTHRRKSHKKHTRRHHRK